MGRSLGLGVLVAMCLCAAGGPAAGQQKNKEADALAAKVLTFARKNIGKQVGDGECAALAVEALKEAGAQSVGAFKDSPNPGDYVWGQLVYGLEMTPSLRTESTPIGTTVKPGDIIQFRDAKFAGRTPGGTYSSTAPHHTAVIVSVTRDGKTFEVLQQNVNGKKTVGLATIRVNDLKEGWVKVYRPQPK